MKQKYINIKDTHIKIIDYERLNQYYKEGYFKFQNKEGKNGIVLQEGKELIDPELKDLPVFLVNKNDFNALLERAFANENTNLAINNLLNKNPSSSAKNIPYRKVISCFLMVFFAVFSLLMGLFCFLTNVVYFAQNILKLFLFKTSLSIYEEETRLKKMDNLPIYSILIPLYKEELKVRDILKAMNDLNYPKDLLDVKLIVEEDDALTNRTIALHGVPEYVHVIKVPFSLPRTKPKALNYATPFLKGEYVTIYDAEDVPDPDQLLKAVEAFRTLPEKYVCVQAKLNFYNKNENILTKLFSWEYSVWFNYLLHGLSVLQFPIALGGTSNHFKLDKLKEIGYWDPYNVTEDADLGIRIFTRGYKVYVIDSTTLEEAPPEIGAWIAQRARWIKGYLQTLFVYIKAKQSGNIFKIMSIYLFLGGSVYSFFCLPWIIIASSIESNGSVFYLWIINSIFFFPYMYALTFILIKKERFSIRYFRPLDWMLFIFWPFYFCLHTIACYRAVFEIVVSPFKWNKTPHGISNKSPKDVL